MVFGKIVCGELIEEVVDEVGESLGDFIFILESWSEDL